jgi:NAD(P)-dependent dehydrogenase (short-subunit alcohol dehydrogenase family)
MTEPPRPTGVAIVTGAAGGMGAACAARLHEAGWPLLLSDLHAGPLGEVAQALRARGAQVEVLAGDMAAPRYPAELAAALGERQIGALIHTAGLSPTMGDAARILAVDYDATVALIETARPRMAKGACAVLIASMSAYMVAMPEIDAALNALESGEDSTSLRPFADGPGMAYSVAKRAVVRLVAREAPRFGERGARIASISPGLIDTAMGRAEQKASPIMDVMLAQTPLGRLGTADEIATAAAFLCSPAASFISGCDLPVDGGVLAAMGKLPGQG